MQKVSFVVAEAGCESCAARVRAALEPLATVDAVVIDEKDDAATVVLELRNELTVDQVQNALARASTAAGHTYRVRSGSWSARIAEDGRPD